MKILEWILTIISFVFLKPQVRFEKEKKLIVYERQNFICAKRAAAKTRVSMSRRGRSGCVCVTVRLGVKRGDLRLGLGDFIFDLHHRETRASQTANTVARGAHTQTHLLDFDMKLGKVGLDVLTSDAFVPNLHAKVLFEVRDLVAVGVDRNVELSLFGCKKTRR